MRFGTALALTVLGLAATASAKDTTQSALDDARSLAGKGENAKAAERYGDAVALAQAANDVQAEQSVADSLEEWFDKIPPAAAKPAAPKGGTTDAAGDPSGRGALLAAVMRKLDPNRCGAFVSAPCLAREVLTLASETADFSSVADAAKVAAAHAGKTASGRAAAVVAKYAEGLKAVADGKFDAATAPLESAAADACANGWFELAAHASTELVAAWMKLNAPDKAAAAVTATAGRMQGHARVTAVAGWRQMLQSRFPEAPENVTKPVTDLMAAFANGAQPKEGRGGDGARGADGAPGGSGPRVSDVGRLLPRFAKGRPIVSATRTAGGFDVHFATRPASKTASPFSMDGVTYEDQGGVWLTFFGWSAALRVVDLVGDKGGFGGRGPSPVRAFYLLADGETWGVTKDGVVSVSH